MKHFLLLLLILLITACSAGEKPRAAEFVPPAASSANFGDLRVHYNALPTLSLNEAVAREYGFEGITPLGPGAKGLDGLLIDNRDHPDRGFVLQSP